jgi:hypothetical protein
MKMRYLEVPFGPGQEPLRIQLTEVSANVLMLSSKDSMVLLLNSLENWLQINRKMPESQYKQLVEIRAGRTDV